MTASSGSPVAGAGGEEPPMFLQRPSSARSQDVSHVLARTFRHLFTRDTVAPDTVEYLNTSKGGDDQYHEKYVDCLHKVQEERDKRMSEAAMLERHIMQAQARAMSADERALNKSAASLTGFPDLGLPPARSHFRSCIDNELLRQHNLITPEDFATEEQPVVPPPSAPPVPCYARDTKSSNRKVRSSMEKGLLPQSPLPPIVPTEDTISDFHSESLPPVSGRLPKPDVWKDYMGPELREVNRKDLENLQARVDFLKNPRHLPPSAHGGDRSLVKSQKKKPKEIGIKPKADSDGSLRSSIKKRVKSASTVQTTSSMASTYKSRVKSATATLPSRASTWPISIPVTPDTTTGAMEEPRQAGKDKTFVEMRQLTPMLRALPRTPYDKMPDQPSVIFLPSPSAVVFEEYNVGQVYEITLELKNVTSVLRPIRVIPPRTSYFSVGLGQFPGEHGLVAPGMSCHFTVQFSPDSLADFDDYVLVHTQASTPLVIQLQGRRPPPVLSLPDDWDVGQCLVGGMKVSQFTVRNDGGAGRFCMMTQEQWPAANFKSVMSLGTVPIPPFEVRPPVFQLEAGESTVLEVLFVPNDVETYQEKLLMVCDNCHVKHFTISGEGQVAGVQLASVEGGVAEPKPEELCDISAQHLIRFDSLNPYTYTQRTITIKNLTNVDLPYNWVTVKPWIKAKDPAATEDSDPLPDIPTERVQDVDSAFNVEPDKGILRANSTSPYVITYAPPQVQSYHSVLHFVLRNVPCPPVRPDSQEEQQDKAAVKSAGRRDPDQKTRPGSVMPATEPQVEDVTAMEIEARGVCDPLSVALVPYAIHIPGQTLVETAIKKQFRMVNSSMSALVFQWESVTSPYILEVEPPVGELGPGCELELDLSISGQYPGSINHTLLCRVQHMEEPLTLNVQANIKGPEVLIEESKLDFGLVRLGEAAQCRMNIQNSCRVTAKWSIREAKTHADGSDEFTFTPCSGELRPLEGIPLQVRFTPKSCRSLRTVFELLVDDGNTSVVGVQGEIQQPEACLLSSCVTLEDVYLDVPKQQTITLLNQTLLDTTFQWGQLVGDDSNKCSVSMDPACGDIGPRQQLDINLTFTPHITGDLTSLRVPCTVGGMEAGVCLSLSTHVHGLTVEYATQNMKETECSDLLIDFGNDTGLGEITKQYVYIKNNSAITAPFSLHVENFKAKPPTPPEKRVDTFMPNKSGEADDNRGQQDVSVTRSRSQRRNMLNKTPNVADPFSKTPHKAVADLCRSMLREGLGAAFAISPASGVLNPFDEQVVEVTAFTDMWGQYEDTLVCKIEKLPIERIPIRLGVVGCPLHFQMVAAQPKQQPIVRFGTHAAGVAPTIRQMRINNTAPCAIRLDWQTFNEDDTDQQLLDLVVSFGQEFPLKDNEGNEIVPTDTSRPPPLKRQPTDLLPNSPDSSPCGSRTTASSASPADQPSDADLSRPKVIHVTTRSHGGKQSTQPYSIRPSQVVIPGRSNACINVAFTPHSTEDVASEMDCRGYALGYMSMDDDVASIPNAVSRSGGYSLSPLRLEMTALIKPALLSIECHDEEGMRYRAGTSDLMVRGELMPECVKLQSATLSNHTLTALMFRLLAREPFYMIEMDRENRRPTAQLLQTDWCRLQPRQNVRVEVGFRVSLDLLEYLEGGMQEDKQLPEGVELEELEKERKLHFKHDLIIEFNNKSVQRVPLHGTLVIPALHLSRYELDFGTCLVGQQREMQIILSNPTAAASFFTVVEERKSSTCAATTFSVSPSSGILEAQINNLAHNKCLLHIFYTPKHSEEYESVFLVHGMLGEEPRRLTIRGHGSYDGKYEAQVNV